MKLVVICFQRHNTSCSGFRRLWVAFIQLCTLLPFYCIVLNFSFRLPPPNSCLSVNRLNSAMQALLLPWVPILSISVAGRDPGFKINAPVKPRVLAYVTKLTPSKYPVAYHLHWNPFRPFSFVVPDDPCHCPVFGSVSAALSCLCSQMTSAQILALLLYVSLTFDWGRWTPAPYKIKLPFCLTSWSVGVLTCLALQRPGWLRGKPQQTWQKSPLEVSLFPKYQEAREEAVGLACSSRLPTNLPPFFYLPILAWDQYLELSNSAGRAWTVWTFIANADQLWYILWPISGHTALHVYTSSRSGGDGGFCFSRWYLVLGCQFADILESFDLDQRV